MRTCGTRYCLQLICRCQRLGCHGIAAHAAPVEDGKSEVDFVATWIRLGAAAVVEYRVTAHTQLYVGEAVDGFQALGLGADVQGTLCELNIQTTVARGLCHLGGFTRCAVPGFQRTLRFRARYSAWRGLRFRFVEGVYEAYVNFMFRPALQIITAYMVLPWVRMHQHDYTVTGHRFGGKRFRFAGDLGTYYIPFLISIGLGFAAYVLMVLVVMGGAFLGAAASGGGEPGGPPSTGMLVGIFAPLIVVYLALLALPIYLRTKHMNLMWRYASLGGHRFECTLRARDMIWIYFSNGVAIVLSVGLLVPWAMIRIARYRARHFALLADGELDHFVAEAERAEGANLRGEIIRNHCIGNGDIPADHLDVQARFKHHIGSLRVGPDVELRECGDVARQDASACHADAALHPRCKQWLTAHRYGDVGERPEGDEFDLAWSVAERLNHCTDAVVRGGHATTEVKANVAHAVFAMHHLGRLERARQWLGGTGVHGYFGTTSLTKSSLMWIFHALPCGIHEMT